MLTKTLRTGLFLVLVTVSAVAQKTMTVGIPTAEFNFASAAQMRTEWCWAASIQMILNWYNVPVRQADVVDRIYGRTIDAAASEDAITKALTGTAYDRTQRKVHLSAHRYRGVPPSNWLLDELGRQHPVLVTFRSSKTMLHAVVLTSAEYETQRDGRVHITALTFRDPSPTIRGRKAAGAVRISGQQLARFVRSVSSYYEVSVRV